MEKRIYLDNAATTMVDSRVISKMNECHTNQHGNASSIHAEGMGAKQALENSREIIAASINAEQSEIVFTSGGTESNNFALKAIAFGNRERGNHIITSRIEHKCVLDSCKWLSGQGFRVTYVGVDKYGFINPQEIEKAINDKTVLVSIIHGNNEIGTLQDLKAIGDICTKKKVYFHTDACQSYTKAELDVRKFGLSLVTLNAHKIHGPKGVGAFYIKKGTRIRAWQHGGNQEFGYRSGTENVPGIVGFAEAVRISSKDDVEGMTRLRDSMIKMILEKIPYAVLNGPAGAGRLCNNINVRFAAIEGEALVELLDIEGISCSTGSACSSKSLDPSYVLMALGLREQDANGSIRISISKYTTVDEARIFVDKLASAVSRLRQMSPFKAGDV